LRSRWVLTGELVLRTAAHLGGEDRGPADVNLVRDWVDGSPLLLGSSLAGALRGHLADRLGGYRSPERGDVARLFGGARADDDGSQSPLIVFDSLGRTAGGPAEVRDGVGIDAATGTAAEHKKYDLEVLPPGTVFPVRFELLIDQDVEDEPRLVGLLVSALGGLADGEIALGARRSRGLGAVDARGWRAHRFNLTTAAGWIAWAVSDPLDAVPATVGPSPEPEACVRAAWPHAVLPAPVDERRRVRVTADLTVRGGLLVRSPATTADAPDAVHLWSGGQGVLPGTSLAGVLRARAGRILRVLGAPEPAVAAAVGRLFGPALGQGAARRRDPAWASRLRVSEAVVEGGDRIRQTRIRVDRATQGVVPGALFEEEPQVGGRLTTHIELRDPQRGETGLLLLLLKDLLSGDLTVGGAAAVGRGVLDGTAEVHLPGEPALRLAPELTDLAVLERLDAEVTELIDHLSARQEATS